MWLWPLTAFLSVCILVAGLIYLTSGPRPARVAADDSGPPVIGTKARERDAQGRETDALARSRRKPVLDRGEEISRRIVELETAVNRFEAEVPSLLTDEEGKALASNRAFVSAYRSLMDESRPGKREVEAFRARVMELLKPVKDAADEGGSYVPSGEVTAQLDREQELVGKALKSLKDALSLIDGLRAEAKRSGAKGTLTLKEVIAATQAQEAKERAETIDAAARKAREEETRKFADAKAESVRLEGEKERELELARRTTALAAKERETLTRLAKDPAIQAEYQAFLVPGRFTFARGDNAYSERSLPLSLTTIKRNCCLNDTKRFAQAMCGEWVRDNLDNVVVNGGSNDRPKSVWPRSDADWKRWDELYDRFCRLAPVWVEMGLLGK